MVFIEVRCILCKDSKIRKHGRQPNGTQRYVCLNNECSKKTFVLQYQQRGKDPEVKKQIIEMAMNGSGVRDTSRVLKVSQNTVMNEIKKKQKSLSQVNHCALEQAKSSDAVEVVYHTDVGMDEMWSYVQKKTKPRWLWYAIDHNSSKVLAYVLGRRKDKVFKTLRGLLESFQINYYSDHWGAYSRHLGPEKHIVGKSRTQKIEWQNLTLRTRIKRLARKTICFSKSVLMHDIVIGLFINRYEFGSAL